MVQGEYYQSGHSQGIEATLTCNGLQWVVRADRRERVYDCDETEVSDRLGKLPRQITFEDGSQFITKDNNGIDQLLKESGLANKTGWIHSLESRWRWALLSFAGAIVSVVLLFTVGMPIIAKPLAHSLPEGIPQRLDAEVLRFLDARMMGESQLDEQAKVHITRLFNSIPDSKDMQLLFRSGGILGANALALPHGTIIITDELLLMNHRQKAPEEETEEEDQSILDILLPGDDEASEEEVEEALEDLIEEEQEPISRYDILSDGEIVAVLGHEVGHVVHKHSMRNLIQSTGVAFTMGLLLGDLSFVTDIILVSGPTLIQQLSYSRNFEREADAYAFMVLKEQNRSTSCFADLMEKLQRYHSGSEDKEEEESSDYLSTHPHSEERINNARTDRACGS